MTETAPLTSPCTGKCGIHEALPWCKGCGRALEEIEAWPVSSAARRDMIMRDLPGRMRILGLE